MLKKLYIIILLFSYAFFLKSQTNIDDQVRKAKAEIYYNNLSNAENILQHIIVEENSNVDVFMTLGDVYFNQKKYEIAAEQYKHSFKLNNNYALLRIAECYAIMNNTVKSVEYLSAYLKTKDKLLQSEIKLNPNFQAISNSKEWINLWKQEHYNAYELKLDEGKFLISKQDYTQAFEILDQLLYKNPERHKALELRGDIFMLKNEYSQAAKTYMKASEIKKQQVSYKIKASEAYFKLEKYNKAYKISEEAVNLDSYNTDLPILQAEILFNMQNFSKAEESLNRMITYYPDHVEANILSGKIAYENSNFIKALEYFNTALKQTGNNSDYFILRADTYVKINMLNEAINDYSMSLDLNPKLSEVYYKRGIAETLNHDLNSACKDFKTAFNLGFYKASDYIVKYCKE